MLIAVYAIYTAFGVSEVFGYSAGLSYDDAELVKQQSAGDVAMGMLLPTDSILLFLLLAVVTALHVGARKSVFGITWMTRTGMLVTLGSFVLSLFKISVLFPLLFSMIGFGVSTAGSPSDLHAPSAKEYVLSDVELITYTSGANRVTGSVTNTSSYDWETVTVDFILKDKAGKACYRANQQLKYIGQGQVAQLVTGRIETYMLAQPSCGATAVTMAVTGFDVDSRSTKDPENDAPQVPAFTSLKPLLEPDTLGMLRASVTGVVDRTSREQLDLKTGSQDTSEFMFELVRTDGVRLDMCFKPKVIAPDGSFMTGRYHSPVDQGVIASAVFVPHCDGS
ncbi:hypothetical protein AB4Y67_02875 [Arthrobacter sp. YAF17]|uniref:hypothetical protein n=1 Tax=Arthrobacter sp. YAF17 TaxID=3233077 RepID=UPI003F923179